MPIEATFTLDGQPLADATVSFIRTDGESGRAAYGLTDGDGKTQLTTFEKFDGALPGAYSVVVVRAGDSFGTQPEPSVEQTAEQMLMASVPNAAAMRRPSPSAERNALRAYSSPGTTPLKCEVEAGMDDPHFELKSE